MPRLYLPTPRLYLPTPHLYLSMRHIYLPTPHIYLPTPHIYLPTPRLYLSMPYLYLPMPYAGKPSFRLLEEALPRSRTPVLTEGHHARSNAHNDRPPALRQECRESRAFLFGFLEESPHVFCGRWFRRTGRKPRSGVLLGKELQKRVKYLPLAGKRPQNKLN
jgi:hypothetical protein